uniref:Uncharacterized protein n=1 Tax=Thrips tabaci associated tombus-like virus 1 TaxID=2767260 RepID=A0A7G9IR86_9TOMB|nr:hypothetical protein [Thrips tabaci associated tombus-like virus 1]
MRDEIRPDGLTVKGELLEYVDLAEHYDGFSINKTQTGKDPLIDFDNFVIRLFKTKYAGPFGATAKWDVLTLLRLHSSFETFELMGSKPFGVRIVYTVAPAPNENEPSNNSGIFVHGRVVDFTGSGIHTLDYNEDRVDERDDRFPSLDQKQWKHTICDAATFSTYGTASADEVMREPGLWVFKSRVTNQNDEWGLRTREAISLLITLSVVITGDLKVKDTVRLPEWLFDG